MSMKESIASEAELAKSTVLNSTIDDDTKRNLVLLISKAAYATNGITPEEKIQYMTECMSSLASVLALYISKTSSQIISLEQRFDNEYPDSELEKIQKFEHMLSEVEQFRNTNGVVPNIRINGENFKDLIDKNSKYIVSKMLNANDNDKNLKGNKLLVWSIVNILKKPYFWIFASVAVCSPFIVDIINAILRAFGINS